MYVCMCTVVLKEGVDCTYMYMYMYIHGFEFHPRKSDCLGCAVLLCLVVCLTLLASSISSLINTCKIVTVRTFTLYLSQPCL